MEDLIKLLTDQVWALQNRNAYLENQNAEAKELLKSIITDMQGPNVIDERPNFMDEMFNKPLQQLENLF